MGVRYDVGRMRVLTSYAEPIDQTVNLYVGGELFPISVVEERFGNVDGGLKLPPQRSVPAYSSDSDECSSGDGESVDGFEGRFGGFDEDEALCDSDARYEPPVNIAGDHVTTLGLLFSSDHSSAMREKALATLGNSVQKLSLCSEVGCGFGDRESGVGGTVMVMGETNLAGSPSICGVSAELEVAVSSAPFGEFEDISRVEDSFHDEGPAVMDRVAHGIGSGLKLLISAQDNNMLDKSSLGLKSCVGPIILDQHSNELNGQLNRCVGPIIVDQQNENNNGNIVSNLEPMEVGLVNNFVDDSISPSTSTVMPSQRVVSSRGAAPLATKVGGRRGKGVRGGRGGGGRGILVPGGFSTSQRFMHLARGIGRRPRVAASVTETPSINLYVELPNLNDMPSGGNCGIDDVGGDDHGNSEGNLSVGSLGGTGDASAQVGVSAAKRLLTIGRRIGVTFGCGEETMIGKLVQLEERDKSEKEGRVLRDNGNQ